LKEVILTPDGFKKLQAEIEFLSIDKRREIADRIREAREFGDIAENAEYDSAKNEQAHLEARIALLEERLKSARVVTKKEIKSGEVSVGTTVRLRDVKAGKTVEYHIVGSAEANPAENKLSNESPVGKAIMGKKQRNEQKTEDRAPEWLVTDANASFCGKSYRAWSAEKAAMKAFRDFKGLEHVTLYRRDEPEEVFRFANQEVVVSQDSRSRRRVETRRNRRDQKRVVENDFGFFDE